MHLGFGIFHKQQDLKYFPLDTLTLKELVVWSVSTHKARSAFNTQITAKTEMRNTTLRKTETRREEGREEQVI